MAFHARYSASGSKRWLTCCGSPWMEKQAEKRFGKEESSEFAMLGTAAHGIGEICLESNDRSTERCRDDIVCIDKHGDAVHFAVGDGDGAAIEEYKAWVEGYKEEMGKDPTEFVVDDDMLSAVQVYLDHCYEIIDKHPDGEILIEKTFKLDHLHEALGGTGDFSLSVPFGDLYISDYKNGSGVPVEVEDNTQLMIYAVGALEEFPDSDGWVHMGVIQPRCPHADGPVRESRIPVEELETFRDEVLVPGAHRIDQASAEADEAGAMPMEYLVDGGHCTFCKALATCPKVMARAEQLAALDFDDDPEELGKTLEDLNVPESNTDIAQAARWTKLMEAWCKAVNTKGQALLEKGEEVPGQKLVRGKSNRAWSSEQKTLENGLRRFGLKKADMFSDPKFKSPAQIEKMKTSIEDKEKQAKLLEFVGNHTEKPEGKLTMVPESDRREAVAPTAVSDFDDDVSDLDDMLS